MNQTGGQLDSRSKQPLLADKIYLKQYSCDRESISTPGFRMRSGKHQIEPSMDSQVSKKRQKFLSKGYAAIGQGSSFYYPNANNTSLKVNSVHE